MTKADLFKLKQVENDIINICRNNGISGNQLTTIGFKFSEIERKEAKNRGEDESLKYLAVLNT